MASGRVCTGCGSALPLAVGSDETDLCPACTAAADPVSDAADPARAVAPVATRDSRGRRQRTDDGDPDKEQARARMKASKQCATAMYAAIAAAPLFCFIGMYGVAVCGLIAVIMGAIGLVGLARTGMGPITTTPGMVRASARMARRCKPQGWLGLGLGLAELFGAPAFIALQIIAESG